MGIRFKTEEGIEVGVSGTSGHIKPLEIKVANNMEEWLAGNPQNPRDDKSNPANHGIHSVPAEQQGKGISSNQALQELRKKQSTSIAESKEIEESREVLFTLMSKISDLERDNKRLKGIIDEIKNIL